MKKNALTSVLGVGSILFIIYYLLKKNGGTLAGNKEGYKVRIDTDAAIDLALHPFNLHPRVLHYAKMGARKIVSDVASPRGIEQGRL